MVKSMSVEKSTEEQQNQRSVSSYRGVRKRKWGKYVSEIRLPNSRQRIWLGSYDSAEKAARAFDAAMFCLRGSGARFNFASDPPNIAGGRSMTPSQIQIAAARFANSESGKKSAGSASASVSVSGQAVMSLTSDEETTSFVVTSDSNNDNNNNNTNALSPPLSEVTVQNDTELATGSIADIFSDLGSGDFVPDFSEFPSFDDFSRDFFVHELPGFDYGEENLDGLIIQENQDSFLWNF